MKYNYNIHKIKKSTKFKIDTFCCTNDLIHLSLIFQLLNQIFFHYNADLFKLTFRI